MDEYEQLARAIQVLRRAKTDSEHKVSELKVLKKRGFPVDAELADVKKRLADEKKVLAESFALLDKLAEDVPSIPSYADFSYADMPPDAQHAAKVAEYGAMMRGGSYDEEEEYVPEPPPYVDVWDWMYLGGMKRSRPPTTPPRGAAPAYKEPPPAPGRAAPGGKSGEPKPTLKDIRYREQHGKFPPAFESRLARWLALGNPLVFDDVEGGARCKCRGGGKFKEQLLESLSDMLDDFTEMYNVGHDADVIDRLYSEGAQRLREAPKSRGNPELEGKKQDIVDEQLRKVDAYLKTLIPKSGVPHLPAKQSKVASLLPRARRMSSESAPSVSLSKKEFAPVRPRGGKRMCGGARYLLNTGKIINQAEADALLKRIRDMPTTAPDYKTLYMRYFTKTEIPDTLPSKEAAPAKKINPIFRVNQLMAEKGISMAEAEKLVSADMAKNPGAYQKASEITAAAPRESPVKARVDALVKKGIPRADAEKLVSEGMKAHSLAFTAPKQQTRNVNAIARIGQLMRERGITEAQAEKIVFEELKTKPQQFD